MRQRTIVFHSCIHLPQLCLPLTAYQEMRIYLHNKSFEVVLQYVWHTLTLSKLTGGIKAFLYD